MPYVSSDEYIALNGENGGGYYAFKDCDLTSIIIPDGVKTIGYRAFESCNNLIDITIPDSVVKIEYNPFQDTPWFNKKHEENLLVIVNSILIDGKICNGDVVIPENVTQIGDGAFSGSNINSITIPDSVISIGDCAFGYCNNLLSVIIPKNVQVCNTDTFYYCENLNEITFLNPECKINFQYIGQGMCKNGVIKGYENSTAQEYAERYGYKFNTLEN